MEDKICLDTDFLVNFLRNKREEADFVKKNEADKDLATTYISLFELYYGAYKSSQVQNNIDAILSLISRINVLNFSNESVDKAGKILARLNKQGTTIELRDLFIGTIALVNKYAVKTKNARHFSRIDGLRVLD